MRSVTDALLGLCVGDALGVPVEFHSRESLAKKPVTKMLGYGTHNQPPGTWSDDSSLALCLAESLCRGYDVSAIAETALAWYKHAHWTAHGTVFDIGVATSVALHKIATGTSPLLAGGTGEFDNGNGSLMRMLPLIFAISDQPIQERFRMVSEVSAITHGHIRSAFACFLYCEYALLLMQKIDKHRAIKLLQTNIRGFLAEHSIIQEDELNRFHRILENAVGPCNIMPLNEYARSEIASSGYVIHTLEASLWCFLTTDTYKQAVLKAVNLGNDTDTTGCVTGGLAGLYYGAKTIPKVWLDTLVRKNDILDLAERLEKRYGYNSTTTPRPGCCI